MKETKRYHFKFYRSYFDIANKLNDEDRLAFLDAIMNKQFLNEEPKDLSFVSELAYESQRHGIEKSLKGWLDRTKTDLQGKPLPQTLSKGVPKTLSKTLANKEEGERKKEKSINIGFEEFWIAYDKKRGRSKSERKWSILTDSEREKAMAHVPAYVRSTPDKKLRKDPMTYLNGQAWEDEIIYNEPPKQTGTGFTAYGTKKM